MESPSFPSRESITLSSLWPQNGQVIRFPRFSAVQRSSFHLRLKLTHGGWNAGFTPRISRNHVPAGLRLHRRRTDRAQHGRTDTCLGTGKTRVVANVAGPGVEYPASYGVPAANYPDPVPDSRSDGPDRRCAVGPDRSSGAPALHRN